MASSQLNDLKGYITKTLSFKSTPDGDIKVDVTYPEKDDGSPATVLIHYHGGFLVSWVRCLDSSEMAMLIL